MGQSHRSTTFTTKTVSEATTASTTSSLCADPRTIATTCESGLSETPKGGNLLWSWLEKLQKSGTRQMKVGSGTQNTRNASQQIKLLPNSIAHTVARSMKGIWASVNGGFARHPAKLLHELHQALTTNSALAQFAEPSSAPTSTEKLKPALRVVGKRLSPRQDVYGMAVEDAGVYYANGVLVSNCDALQYLCLHADAQQGGKFTKHKAREIEDVSMSGWT